MSAHLIVHGVVLGTPVFKEMKGGGLTASFRVKSERYDFGQGKRVADPYTLFAYGAIAETLRNESVGEGDTVVAMASVEVDANGLFILSVSKLARPPFDGFETHIFCGAVEKGSFKEFPRQDGKDGAVVNGTVRVPIITSKGDEINRNIRFAAWDGRGRGIAKACVLEEESEEERRWMLFVGTPRREKYTTQDGEERYVEKTTVESMDFTDVKTLPHRRTYGGAVEGHEMKSGDLGNWQPPPPDYDHDDDIPF